MYKEELIKLKEYHVVQFAFDEIRVVSMVALENIFRAIEKKGKRQLVINLWEIEEYGYWFYLLGTLNVNREICIVNHYEDTKVEMKKIFDLFYLQLASMSVDKQDSFDCVNCKNDNIVLTCSEYLFDLIVKKEKRFCILDELKGKYNFLCI